MINATQVDAQTWVIELSGKFDFQSRHEFPEAITQAAETSPRRIILDLSCVSHVDSAGLGLMTLAHKNLTPQGVQIVMVTIQGSTRDVLLLTNMDKLFPLYDSVAQASQAPHASVPVET